MGVGYCFFQQRKKKALSNSGFYRPLYFYSYTSSCVTVSFNV